jgi:2'-5' RNA ligase
MQFSLPGFDTPQKQTDRLFFAIFPDGDAAARIAQLARHLRGEHGLKGKPLEAQRLHVTLHHLGDFAGLPQDIIAMACQAAATDAMPPFEITFDRVVSFSRSPAKLPFVLLRGNEVPALTMLQRALGMAMGKAGLKVSHTKSSYTPHVTLLYDDHAVPEQAVETVAWTAQEFVLVHSLLGEHRHVPLARWALRP